ncbi:hypothetical protein AAVH_24593 [Aphelenchoides avenae]|nr:hypothetical protein AAVH_24593 [Aphelenchus avenae]
MSSLPSEVLEDVLQPLDRWTLDGVQFTNRRFLQVIMERVSNVCLRAIHNASFRAPKENENTDGSSFTIHIDDRWKRDVSNAHTDITRLFSQFVQALRSSHVAELKLHGLVFKPEFVALVLQTPIVAGDLTFDAGSCAEVTAAQFRGVLTHFSPTLLFLDTCRLTPVDGAKYAVTDDPVVEFCVQEDVPVGEDGVASIQRSFGELFLPNGRFTKDLFKRLIEASSVSKRTKPLRIVVGPPRFEEEDLRDFAQQLSYSFRGKPYQQRIYNFPGERHGPVAAIDLQIVLHNDHTLELIRARRPHTLFYESDE